MKSSDFITDDTNALGHGTAKGVEFLLTATKRFLLVNYDSEGPLKSTLSLSIDFVWPKYTCTSI